jgi:hypothetical protein
MNVNELKVLSQATKKKILEIDLEFEEENIPENSFPVEIFPEEVQVMILAMNQSLNFNSDFLSISIISAFASIFGNKYKLQVKTGWNAAPIFWFAAVGSPGTNKTHPLAMILNPIMKVDKSYKEMYDRELKEYMSLPDGEKKNGKRPFYKHYILNDATIESIYHIHSNNKKGLLFYKDELIGFINEMDKYRKKGGDKQFWMQSFNNSQYTVNRKGSEPIVVDNICINIIGTIQPDILINMLNNADEDGFTDRFLFTKAETTVFPQMDIDLDPVFLDFWEESITNLERWLIYVDEEDTVYFPYSKEAKQYFFKKDLEWTSLQNSENVTNAMKNFISKLKTYVHRFALIIELIDNVFTVRNPDEIKDVSKSSLEKAYKVVEYFYDSARGVYQQKDKSNEVKEISDRLNGKSVVEKIVDLHEKGVKQTEIAKSLNKSKAYISKVLSKLKKE